MRGRCLSVIVGREAVDMAPYARDAALLMGANVRHARIDRRWTAAELGAHAGSSRHTIATIEQGRPSVVDG
jgi:hypothetical protein